ncbi:MAG: alpha/beta hydrolase [Merismopedia sp. SIO2A8]|nr:alpha/beta hydrolase [Merismopedia sp. SIO2A8]
MNFLSNSSLIPSPPLAAALTETTSIDLFQAIQTKAIATPLCQEPILTTYVSSADPSSPSDNTPIVLLHGFDSSVMELRRLFPLLAAHHETWAIDLLGFGFTERPDTLTFSATTIKEHFFHTWQTLINRPMVLVGTSMGGAAAIDFCLAYPHAVEKLVLIDSAGLTRSPNLGSIMIPPLSWFAAEFLRNRQVRKGISKAAYFDKQWASEDALTCSMLHVTRPNWRQSMISFARNGGYTRVSQPMVEKITCPTLILWGRNDEILGTKDAPKFAQAIADSKLVWCDRCGHVPHLEQPEQTATYILEFL